MAVLARITVGGILVFQVNADPDGVITAPKGSYAFDSSNAVAYQNQDGATLWSTITPGGSVIGAFLTFGVANIGASTTTRFLDPWYSAGTALAPTTPIQYRLPTACTLKKFRMRHNTPSANVNLIVYTLRIDNVATALSVSLAANASDGSDLVNTVSAPANARIDVEVTKAVAIGSGGLDIIGSLECV